MLLKNFFKILGPTVRHRATIAAFQEVRIPVPWGHIAGKWYGPTNKRPILSLHGWQDNCGTFNRLIPLLNKDLSFLAIDLPGHGLSSRLPDGMYYHISNYILVVDYLVNYFKWPKSSFLGHSLGGIVCFTYNLLHPDKVDFLICLDALMPTRTKHDISILRERLSKFWRQNSYAFSKNEPPSYPMPEILQKIALSLNNSVELQHAHHLAQRSVGTSKTFPDQYYFTLDPRLRIGDMVLLIQDDIIDGCKNVQCPMLVIKAKQAPYFVQKSHFYEVISILRKYCKDFTYEKVEGTHHIHLNNPERVAPIINAFLDKFNVEDRTDMGIKDEMRISAY